MDSSNLIDLVDEAIIFYSADRGGRGLSGVYEWSKGNSGRETIYRLFEKMNSFPKTSRYSIDDTLREEMIKDLLS